MGVPMKILLLESCDRESEQLIGPYTTLDKAADYVASEGWKRPEWQLSLTGQSWLTEPEDEFGQFWRVTEYEVDAVPEDD
jgi:hypothetical protein